MQSQDAQRVAARIALGKALREHRRAAGLSGAEVGERLGWSQSKVSRIEAARVRPEVADVQALLELYGVAGRKRRQALALAEESAGPPSEWRNSTRVGLTRRQKDFVAFEASATAIWHYQPAIIPGPLQTREYALRVLAIVRHPDPERAVETRVARQRAIFAAGGPRVRIVLAEQAVRWDPGPDGVLAGQLASMADLLELHKVELRLIPFDVEQRAFLAHPVVVYEFAQEDAEAVVETTTTDLRIKDPVDVTLLRDRIDSLCAVALDPTDSIDYVRKLSAQRRRRRNG